MTDDDVSLDKSVETITSTLLDAAIQQNPDAWKKLVDIYSPLILAWCQRRAVPLPDSENIGQEVFIAVSKNLYRFDRSQPGQSFRKWLCQITLNKIRDYWRKLRREPMAEGGSEAHQALQELPSPEFDEVLESDDDIRILYNQIVSWIRGEFEQTTWDAFHLTIVDEMTPADAAAELGISLNAVYLARSRVLRRLRTEFGIT
jgi:RNA polymerase sigma-70 factor (ECF subfamily)